MSIESNKSTIRTFFEAANQGDLETSFGLFSDDVVWTNVGSNSLAGTYRGKGGLMQELLGPLFGQLEAGIRSELTGLVAEDDRVVAFTNGSARTVDGRPYDNTYCHVFRLAGGKIVEVIEYCDTLLAERVFGPDAPEA